VEQKDYPTQLRAFAIAAAAIPNLRMAIAGDGPLRSTLEELARQLSIADRVRFLGNQDDVTILLRSVDLFALSSKFEPFGVALLEAKAAGLPIVATTVNEIPEIVADGESGLLTTPGHAAGMAAAFIKLALDRDYRLRLGARARVEARRNCLQAAVTAYEALYDDLFESPLRRVTEAPAVSV
jgi:glycosyltransferase involved in cell wall biosynthesis